MSMKEYIWPNIILPLILTSISMTGMACDPSKHQPPAPPEHTVKVGARVIKGPLVEVVNVPLAEKERISKALDQQATVRLTLRGVRSQPALTLRAFVNKDDADAQTSIKDPHYLGSISFFGDAGVTGDYLLDASQTLRELNKGTAKEWDQLKVTLVPVPVGSASDTNVTPIAFKSIDLSIAGPK
jgi:hypothetical protein